MVEVFQTNVEQIKHSKMLTKQLLCRFSESKVSFDLDDCDRILRVEGENIETQSIIELLNVNGYYCEILK